jgi:pimeloyl-ACP methyl ester carboxylesterase
MTLLAVGLWMAMAGTAAELPRGVVIPQVVCRNAPRFSYALYLPKSLPGGPVPLLLLFDPSGDGVSAVMRFREAAEATRTAVAGSLDSRNGLSWEEFGEILPAFWNDVNERFPGGLRFVGGFSGGARIALGMTLLHPRDIDGLFSAGAFFDTGTQMPPAAVAVYMISGIRDANLPELRRADSMRSEEHAAPHRFVTFSGGHEWPNEKECREALTWLRREAASP